LCGCPLAIKLNFQCSRGEALYPERFFPGDVQCGIPWNTVAQSAVHFACPEHEHAAMYESVKAMEPIATTKKAMTEANSVRLEPLVASAGSRVKTHKQQSELIDKAGLSGAVTSPE